MNDIEIEQIKESDIDELCDLIVNKVDKVSCHLDGAKHDSWIADMRRFFEASISDQRTYTIVVRYKNEIIGCGAGIIVLDDPQCYWLDGNKYGYIRLMRVDPKIQNKGIGKKILDDILKWFELNKVRSIQLHASRESKSLYERSGFHNTDNVIEMWREIKS